MKIDEGDWIKNRKMQGRNDCDVRKRAALASLGRRVLPPCCEWQPLHVGTFRNWDFHLFFYSEFTKLVSLRCNFLFIYVFQLFIQINRYGWM